MGTDIPRRTGRRAAHQLSVAQLQQELDFRRAIDSSLGEGVYALDREGRVSYMNPAAERILGWTEAELHGRIMHDAIHYRRPDGSPFPLDECTGLAEVLRSTIRVRTDEDHFIRKDGTMIPVAYTASPIIARDTVEGVVVAFQDISERKHAEASLRESEERYRRLVELSPNALFVHSAGTFVFSNRAGARLLGAERPDDLVGRPILSFVHPDFHATVRQRAEHVLQEGVSAPLVEQQLIRLDGQVIYAEVAAAPIMFEGKAAVQTVIRDVTRRKQAEEALRNSRDQLDIILGGVADGITAQDASGKIVYANHAAARLAGFASPEAMLRAERAELMQQFEIMDSDGRPLPLEQLPGRLVFLGVDDVTSPETVVRYRICATGDERWAIVRARPVRDRQGQVQLAINIFRDITEQRRVDELLQVRARQQAAVAELGRRALSLVDIASLMQETTRLVTQILAVEYCEILELDPQADALLLRAGTGWPEASVGQVVADASVQSQAGYTLQSNGPVVTGDLATERRFHVAPLVRAAGAISSISVPIHGWTGPFGVLEADTIRRRDFVDDDIYFLQSVANVLTAAIERKAVEEQLAHERAESERRAELDRLRREFIASVSHELRTPLTTMRGGLGMLDTSLSGRLRPDEHQLLGHARRSVEHLRRMIDNLLALNQLDAGTLQLEQRPLDLRSVVVDTISVVYPLLEQKGQQLDVDLPEPLPVMGDPRWLAQVLTNLLANAHQHTPAGTRIVLSSSRGSSDICLTVSDSGPGLDGEDLDPSFGNIDRLGSEQGGTGLGLAIVGAIVERHGGHLLVRSAPGDDTTFSIVLPRVVENQEE